MMAAKREPKSTEWVVLEATREEGEVTPSAWREVGRHTSRSRAEAYDVVVGEKTGRFKAIAAASWKGGKVKVQETLVTSKPLED